MEPTEHFGIYFGYIQRFFQRRVSPFKCKVYSLSLVHHCFQGFAANGGASLNDASSTLSQSIGPGGAHQFTHNQANSNQFGGFGFWRLLRNPTASPWTHYSTCSNKTCKSKCPGVDNIAWFKRQIRTSTNYHVGNVMHNKEVNLLLSFSRLTRPTPTTRTTATSLGLNSSGFSEMRQFLRVDTCVNKTSSPRD